MNTAGSHVARKITRTLAITGGIVVTGLLANRVLEAQTGGLERARQAEQRRIEVIQRAMPATISVFSTDGQGGGSGVVVTPDGYALTNFHVVDPCGSYMHCSMPDGRIFDAVLVGMDPVGDVAMIKLLGRDDFPTATLANSDTVRTGDYCFAVGNPFLLATNFQPSVSWGIVSGVHRYQYPSNTLLEYADCIQTDAAINPGNSGGPLFNARGELIGINGRCSFEKRGRVNVGVGYAISINQIKMFWDHLASGRIVDHATLGATVAADHNGRVTVRDILSGSDAWRRGLRFGDEIISVDGRPLSSVNEFKNALGIYPAEWRLPLEYRRGETTTSIWVRLESAHSPQNLAALVQRRGPEIPRESGPEAESTRRHAGPPVPDAVQALIEQRAGFANYYFNRSRQEAIWKSFQQSAGAGPLPETLLMTGQLGEGISVQLALALDKSGIRWADQSRVLDARLDPGLQTEPPGSGGLLPALHFWYRLIRQGPAGLGDVFYLGSLPTGAGETSDVLVCNTEGVQVRFLFDPETGLLTGIEFWSAMDQDPAEIRLGDYRLSDQCLLPHRMQVTCGDSFRWDLQFDQISAGQSP